MILEIAMLQVRPGLTQEFESNFAVASKILSSMPGYLGHSLRRCIEEKNKYALLITWETLEAHTEGFRKSSGYLEWKALLYHFYDPFPIVEHFEDLSP
ncbi:MAG TPA: antibiotic biosynthesis monooxygenase [Leptospiraceae bacterium]|nr:antibiotic biosynthesis monooxygenase [Leptospiraceae bacterium]